MEARAVNPNVLMMLLAKRSNTSSTGVFGHIEPEEEDDVIPRHRLKGEGTAVAKAFGGEPARIEYAPAPGPMHVTLSRPVYVSYGGGISSTASEVVSLVNGVAHRPLETNYTLLLQNVGEARVLRFDFDPATRPLTPLGHLYLSPEQSVRGVLERIRAISPVAEGVAKRIAAIVQSEEEEGIAPEDAIEMRSLFTLETFLKHAGKIAAPSISVSPKRNLYARWKHADGRVVGLEFHPGNRISYAILGRPGANFVRDVSYGLKTSGDLFPILSANGMDGVVKDGR